MNNQIESHSSYDGENSKWHFIPTPIQVLVYFLASCLLLTILNIGRIWHYLSTSLFGNQGGAENFVAAHIPALHGAYHFITHSIILQVMFWALVGCVIYGFIWFGKNIFISLMNDFVADQYVHPPGYNRSKYWESVLMRKVFFTLSLVVLIASFIGGVGFVMALASACYTTVTNFTIVGGTLTLFGSALITTTLIYALTILTYLTTKAWRLIYKDL